MSEIVSINSRWVGFSKTLVLVAATTAGCFLAAGQIRMAFMVVFGMLFMLVAHQTSWGILGYFLFIPFLGFTRRVFLYFLGPVQFDPILILPDVMTLILFLWVLFGYREDILTLLKKSILAKALLAYAMFLLLQAFNPAQGSIALGLSGIKFYLLPMLWVVIGYTQTLFDRRVLFKYLVGLACLATLYGFSQYYFGYGLFETHWIQTVDFASLKVGTLLRPISFFHSQEEYSRFLQMGLGLLLGLSLLAKNGLGIVGVGIMALALYQSGVRSSILGALFMLGMLWVFWPSSRVKKKNRLLGLVVGIVIFAVLISQFNLSRFVPNQESASTNLVLHSTVGILEPFSQGSFKTRLVLWGLVLKKTFLENPLGYGLGTTTTGSTKFFNQADLGGFFQKESYLFSVLFSTGIVGLTLLLVFWFFLLRQIWFFQQSNHSENGLVAAVLLGLVLTNIFGNSAVLYAIAGFYYYLIGQILRAEIFEKI